MMKTNDKSQCKESIETYDHGTLHFIAAICREMGVDNVFNKHLECDKGRKSDIPHGIAAIMMIANLCDGGYQPMHSLQEYYEEKDLEGIFHHSMDLSQINEDRFGYFLECFYKANPRLVFVDLSTRIFLKYGIKVKNVNYDTTSLVMWGEYDCQSDGKTGVVQINFGHSKQKRPDKKQIKMGIGVAEGVVVDAKVLSGNKDDKTYNQENIEDSIQTAKRIGIDGEDFYYIADSALFTPKSLEKLHAPDGCKYITRIPDSYKIVKTLIEKGLDDDLSKDIEFINKHDKKVEYRVQSQMSEYETYKLKTVLVYSKSLEGTKTEKIKKHVLKEYEMLNEKTTKIGKKTYENKEDAEKVISEIKNIKYHKVNFDIVEASMNKPGRPSTKEPSNQKIIKYKILSNITEDIQSVEKKIQSECMFVLATNALHKTGEEILLEYKTQISVENKFQQLKSPNFVNSLYLNKPESIEALCYILLITLMLLSVMEHLVRKGLKEDNESVIGPGKVKMKNPTLKAIIAIFKYMRTQRITRDDYVRTSLFKPLNNCRQRILKYLGMSEESFVWDG